MRIGHDLLSRFALLLCCVSTSFAQSVDTDAALTPLPGETSEAFADRVMRAHGTGAESTAWEIEVARDDGETLVTSAWDWQNPSWVPGQEDSLTGVGFDIEGNFWLAGWTTTGTNTTARYLKFEGGNNESAVTIFDLELQQWSSIRDAALGLDGHLYVTGYDAGTGALAVGKISPEGWVRWLRNLGPPTGGDPIIVLDQDDNPFVYTGENGLDTDWIYGINSSTGGVRWERPDVNVQGVISDPRGELIVLDRYLNDYYRIDAFDGQPTSAPVDIAFNSRYMVLDARRNLYVGWQKFTPEGELLYFLDMPWPPDVVRVHQLENDVSTLTMDPMRSGLRRWTETGELLASRVFDEVFEDLEIDRLGNAYTLSDGYELRKVDSSAEFADVWTCTTSPSAGFTAVEPSEGDDALHIDRGGSIFLVGAETHSQGRRVRVDKFTQATLGIAQKAMEHVNVVSEDRSIWGPGAGRLIESDAFFQESWNEDLSARGCVTVSIPFVDDLVFGGGVGFQTEGEFELGYRAEVDGGTVDLHLPVGIEWDILAAGKSPEPTINEPVNMVPRWQTTPDARMTSCFQPEFNAGLTAGLRFAVYVDIALKFFVEIFDAVLLNTGFRWPGDYIPFTQNPTEDTRGYIPYLNIQYLLQLLNFPDTGAWHTEQDPLGFFEVGMGVPKLMAQGCFTPTLSSDGTTTVGGSFRSTARDKCLDLKAFVTEIVREIADLATPFDIPPVSATLGGMGETDFYLTYRILYLIAFCEFVAQQDLQADIEMRVRYEVSTGGSSDLALHEPFQFTPTSEDTTITPYIYARVDFSNTTILDIVPGIEWETAYAAAGASAFGTRLFGFDFCALCTREDFSVGSLEIGSLSYDFDTPEIEGAPIRIQAREQQPPRIASASRTHMDMLIYDQISPTVNEFNEVLTDPFTTVNKTTNLLLFGEDFRSYNDNDPVVKIAYMGRVEELDSQKLNAATLLVRIPDRFRLLPGVARLWVETMYDPGDGVRTGVSNSFSLPIEMPVPRLDAVNPNPWAADPGLLDLPVALIDQQTIGGTDTFIARRDYFLTLRDQLWNETTVPEQTGDTAESYFPCFDFEQLPPFPAVLVRYEGEEWLPLPRFVQSVDSGLHNVRFAPLNYGSSGIVDVQLCNPGPGGGASRIRPLNVGAPIPQVTRLEPPFIDPGIPLPDGRTTITITVHGPENVITDSSMEEPKFGNFNRSSVVRYNGFDLPTSFTGSGVLKAELPFSVALHTGVAEITVFTPANGSFYFEDLQGMASGMCVDESLTPYPVNSPAECGGDYYPLPGLIPSGGETAPMALPIRYADPVIDVVTPDEAPVGASVFMADPSSAVITPYDPMNPGPEVGFTFSNFSVAGDGFRPGAVVLVDGIPRETNFESRNLLTARLLPEDVATEGARLITVQNPVPQSDVSAEAVFNVIAPPPPPPAGAMQRNNYKSGRRR